MKNEQSNNVPREITLWRGHQVLIGTYLDLEGLNEEIEMGDEYTDTLELDELDMAFWAPRLSQYGLTATAHLTIADRDVKRLGNRMLNASEEWWLQLRPAFNELLEEYRRVSGHELYEVTMVQSAEYDPARN